MSDPLYDVYLSGAAPGADPEQVKANVAQLFKTDVARIEHLFSRTRAIIKSGVDQATAAKYQAALTRAGAQCEIAPAPDTVPPNTAPAEANAPETPVPTPAADAGGGLDSADIAPPGSILVEGEPFEAREVDTSGLSIAEAGEDLVEHEPFKPREVDTSSLSLDPGPDAEPGTES